MARVLALDYGSARCGCAISDPTGTLATPLAPVARPDTLRGLAAIAALVQECSATRVVVGLPLSLSGDDSEQTRAARDFADRLAQRLGNEVTVELLDERLTTRLAARSSAHARSSEDSRAAAHLLESWLAAARAPGGSLP